MNIMDGLSNQQHDAISTDGYYADLLPAIESKAGGTFVHAFSGGGRDIEMIYRALDGNGCFVAIDKDNERINHALSRGTAQTHPQFLRADNAPDLSNAFALNAIAVLQTAFPLEKEYTRALKADFILCNAGIMFIPPQNLASTLNDFAAMLKNDGEMVLRFSQQRADKTDDEGVSYFIHGVQIVAQILEHAGLHVTQNMPIPDPAGRAFMWQDLHAIKPSIDL